MMRTTPDPAPRRTSNDHQHHIIAHLVQRQRVTTEFSFPYRFLANGDLVVVEVSAAGVETTKTLTTHYTLTGAGDDAGGSVTMLVAPANGTRLIIYRDTDIVQETDYISGDPFPAEDPRAGAGPTDHDRAGDRIGCRSLDQGPGGRLVEPEHHAPGVCESPGQVPSVRRRDWCCRGVHGHADPGGQRCCCGLRGRVNR